MSMTENVDYRAFEILNIKTKIMNSLEIIYLVSIIAYAVSLTICTVKKNDWEVNTWDSVPLAVVCMFVPLLNIILTMEFIVEIRKNIKKLSK